MSSNPNVVMISAWKDDVNKDLFGRAIHLMQKSYPNLRWLWVEGDSKDDTYLQLKHIKDTSPIGDRITVVSTTTWVAGDKPAQRLLRLSKTFNYVTQFINPEDDLVIWHESDLQSSVDIVERYIATGKECLGGWPMLHMPGLTGSFLIFYDTWAYRANGKTFDNRYPYHEVYKPDQLFEVESVGSVYMFPAKEVIGPNKIVENQLCVVNLYEQLRARGYKVWVDPTITIIQPSEHWTPQEHFRG